MAKFYGAVGFVPLTETAPGVYRSEPIEKCYMGEITRNTTRWVNGESINDNIELTSTVSIIMDPFASENYQTIKYVEYMGARWKVKSMEIQRPRIILTIGGVYNGE